MAIKTNELIPNETVRMQKLAPVELQNYRYLQKGLRKMHEENPAQDLRVCTDYMDRFLNACIDHGQMINGIKAKANGVPVNPVYLHRESIKAQQAFFDNFQHSVLPGYGADGKETFAQFSREGSPPGFFQGVKDQFLDDKGDMKFGGLIGGLVAGGLALMFGAASNGLMGILMIASAVMAGAFGGNFIGGKIDAMGPKAPDFPDKVPAPQREQAPAQAPVIVRTEQQAPDRQIPDNVREAAKIAAKYSPQNEENPLPQKDLYKKFEDVDISLLPPLPEKSRAPAPKTGKHEHHETPAHGLHGKKQTDTVQTRPNGHGHGA